MRALVVCAVVGDFPGAGAEAGHGDDDARGHLRLAIANLANERDLVVHEAFDTGHRRPLVDEKGERHLDMADFRFEQSGHFSKHVLEGRNGDLALMVVQNRNKARHVRALEVVGQVNVHVESRNCVLLAIAAVTHANGVTDILDSDLVDGDLACIRATLNILDFAGRTAVCSFDHCTHDTLAGT